MRINASRQHSRFRGHRKTIEINATTATELNPKRKNIEMNETLVVHIDINLETSSVEMIEFRIENGYDVQQFFIFTKCIGILVTKEYICCWAIFIALKSNGVDAIMTLIYRLPCEITIGCRRGGGSALYIFVMFDYIDLSSSFTIALCWTDTKFHQRKIVQPLHVHLYHIKIVTFAQQTLQTLYLIAFVLMPIDNRLVLFIPPCEWLSIVYEFYFW